MDIEKILLELLSKTHKKTTEEIKSLIYDDQGELKDDALTVLIDNDKSRIAAIKSQYKTEDELRDEIYGKAKREILTQSEKDLKTFFSVDSDKKGEELFKEINEKLNKSDGSKEITDDDIKKSPIYQNLLTSKQADIDKVNAEWQTKLDETTKDFNHKNVFSVVQSRAKAIAKGLNPILSKDPERANKQLSVIDTYLQGYEFEVNGDTIIAKKDGKILEDEHANAVTFKDLVTKITTGIFDIDEGKGGGGTGNDNDDDGDGGRKPNKKVTSEDELRERLNAETDSGKREKILADYKKELAEAEKADA